MFQFCEPGRKTVDVGVTYAKIDEEWYSGYPTRQDFVSEKVKGNVPVIGHELRDSFRMLERLIGVVGKYNVNVKSNPRISRGRFFGGVSTDQSRSNIRKGEDLGM